MTQLTDKLAVRNAAPERTGETVFDLLKRQAPAIARALPSHISAERYTRIVTTEIRRNPKLAACTPASLLGAVMVSAQLGLEPGPLGAVYLVPYGKEIQLIIGYRGLIELARRSGHVDSIYAEAVFEGDTFEWELGLHRDIRHKPTGPDRDDPNKITYVYAVAHLKDTPEPVFVVMSRIEIDKIRARSKAGGNGPWVTDYQQMALKTAIRRLAKWLPLSVERAQAVAADEAVVRDMPTGLDDLGDVIDVDPVDDTPAELEPAEAEPTA